jgi:hypothetical protein
LGHLQLDSAKSGSSGQTGNPGVGSAREVVTVVVGIVEAVDGEVGDLCGEESEGAEPEDNEKDVESEDGPVVVQHWSAVLSHQEVDASD